MTMTATAEQLAQAADLRNSAKAYDDRRNESFGRCDTDGFLTQWASGLHSQVDRMRAKILEAGGVAEFIGLFDKDNRRVKARLIETKFGYSWLLHEDEVDLITRRGKKFLPEGFNSRILKNLGLREAWEMAPADAKVEGRGYGLSGDAWAAQYRTGCKWGTDATFSRDTNENYD